MSRFSIYPALLGFCLAVATPAAHADRDAAFDERSFPVTLAQASAPDSRDALFGEDAGKPEASKPASREDLFGVEKPAPSKPGTRDDLFGTDVPGSKPSGEKPLGASRPGSTDLTSGWRGYIQPEFA